MSQSIIKMCQDMADRLSGMEKKAQYDIVYYKGAKEAVALIAEEVKRIAEKEENERREQPTAESARPGKLQSGLSEVRKERAKRQKADDKADRS